MSQTFDAYVHKANISLLSKESIGEFQSKLRDAAFQYMVTAMSLQKTDDCWTSEIFGDSAIVCVYKSETVFGGSSRSSNYYRITYSRDKEGVFTFGSYTKVKRTEVWTTVSDGISVKKSLDNTLSPEDFEEISKNLWAPVSVFHGIL